MENSKELTTRKEELNAKTGNIPVVAPLVDIFENEDEILLYADMPGVAKEDVCVDIDNGKLTLSGIRKTANKGVASWEEFGEIEFQRTFAVPQTIDVGKVGATLKDGVLRLNLPKSEAAKPRQIEITAA